MKHRIHHLSNKYLFTIWTIILTIGVVLALVGLQNNSNRDFDRSVAADEAQELAVCHAIVNINQSMRDILSVLSVDTKVTDDMTPSQKESIRIANERRKAYRIIAESMFPVAACPDGYAPTSRQDEFRPLLEMTPAQGTTTTTTTTTGG